MNSIYHLLTGKRSIQTVQDAHLYQLDRFFGIFKKLNKSTFNQVVEELIEQQLLTTPSKSTSVSKPTTKGMEWLEENERHLPLAYFNGLIYHEIDIVFFERLLLLLQVLTNLKMNHSSYIPVIDRPATTKWMKYYYQKQNLQVNIQLEKVYDELFSMLITFSEVEAEMFVDRLTGFQHYGMSVQQLANRYEITVNDVQLLMTGMTHHMLGMIQRKTEAYPLLSGLLEDLHTNGFITQSAQRTYELIDKGLTIDMIAQQRNLRINTIYDHIVEIALYDSNFSIEQFVSKEQQNEVLHIAKQLNTTRLKKIKDVVSEEISYFQIRLALTSKDKLFMK